MAGNVGVGVAPGVKFEVAGAIRSSNQLISTVASGTAPLAVTSSTLVTNLNADLLDNVQGAVYYKDADVVMNTNPFGGRPLYINSIDNAMYAADKKWWVIRTVHNVSHNSETYPKLNPDWVASYSVTGSGTSFVVAGAPTSIIVYNGDTICTIVASSPSGQYQCTYVAGTLTFGATVTGTVYAYPDSDVPMYLDSPAVSTFYTSNAFDGSYESQDTCNSGQYMKIRVQFSEDGKSGTGGYPYGQLFLSYYYTYTPASANLRIFNRNYRLHGIGWSLDNFVDFRNTNASSNYIQSCVPTYAYGRTIMEFIIIGHSSHGTYLTQIDWKLDRPNLSTSGGTVTKFGANSLYNNLNFAVKNVVNASITPTGYFSGKQFGSTIPTGTPPLVIASTTLVNNLNADLLDGQHGSYYAAAGNISGTQNYVAKFNNAGGTTIGNSLIFDNGIMVGLSTVSPVSRLTIESTGGAANASHATTAVNAAISLQSTTGLGTATRLFAGVGGSDYTWLQAQNADNTLKNIVLNPVGGNVGIGTTSPGTKLEVSSTDSSILRLRSTNSGADGVVGSGISSRTGTLDNYENAYINFIQRSSNAIPRTDIAFGVTTTENTVATEVMRIANTGNVGIGTATPYAKLNIKNGSLLLQDTEVVHGMTSIYYENSYANLSKLSTTAGGALLIGISDTDSGGIKIQGVIGTATPSASVPVVSFRADKKNGSSVQALASTDLAFQFINSTSHLVSILGSGHMGLNTISPLERLHVVGNVRVEGPAAPLISFFKSTTNTGYIGTGSDNNIFTGALPDSLAIRATNAMHLGTNGNNIRMTILSTGDVGIATTAPGYKLEVAGTGKFRDTVFFGDAANITDLFLGQLI